MVLQLNVVEKLLSSDKLALRVQWVARRVESANAKSNVGGSGKLAGELRERASVRVRPAVGPRVGPMATSLEKKKAKKRRKLSKPLME